MKRTIAILILSAMIVSFVAPFLGVSRNINKTDVAAQEESTEQTKYLLFENTIDLQEKMKEEVRNYEQNNEKSENDAIREEIAYQEYQVPSNRGFKSYMSYKAVTSKSSSQYKLQSQYAYTGEYGIRQVDERFCVAIGMFSNARVGTYIDLILENGTIIPCIVGDFKANIHTDSSNIVTNHNGCISEFLVDNNVLYSLAKQMGDISYCKEEWKSPVKTIKVYEKNIFDGE